MKIIAQQRTHLAKTSLRQLAEWGAWILLITSVVSLVQLSIPYPLDDDTAYHFSVAKLIREHGILQSFPWTRFSWQFDHYADKEFLFHALFIPFTPLGFNATARIVGIIGGSALLCAIYSVLRTEGVRYAGIWALLPLGTTIFLYRFLQVRPHLFSITFAILFLWAYCREKRGLLFLVALLFPLFYVAFWQIPLMLIIAAEGGRLLYGRRFDTRLLLFVAVGLVVGVALHPNSLNLLEMNRIHMVDVLFRNAWGEHVEFNMGGEFDPLGFSGWFRVLLVPTFFAVAGGYLAWRERKYDPLYPAIAGAMILFALLTARTNRFLEYFVPFSVLTLALLTKKYRKPYLLLACAACSIVFTLYGGGYLFDYIFRQDERSWQMNPALVEKTAALIPVGSNVFTCGWEYTGGLLVNLPDRNYMVALDPTLLYKRDPNLYDLWYRTLLYAPPDAAQTVRKNFDSRYAVCLDDPSLYPFFSALSNNSRVTVLHSDGKWVLFDLGADKPLKAASHEEKPGKALIEYGERE